MCRCVSVCVWTAGSWSAASGGAMRASKCIREPRALTLSAAMEKPGSALVTLPSMLTTRRAWHERSLPRPGLVGNLWRQSRSRRAFEILTPAKASLAQPGHHAIARLSSRMTLRQRTAVTPSRRNGSPLHGMPNRKPRKSLREAVDNAPRTQTEAPPAFTADVGSAVHGQRGADSSNPSLGLLRILGSSKHEPWRNAVSS
ncbi:hypothetical protein BCR34DRAFT_632447 [Clohesyomyces aquaticus]|uniref:Uncharacterized protein n=1 Tax=Clohesyomyces aquaticus TaxID=1231657 RepID=A0A1Y2A4I2_9PLEO|nr:hypothetical protein BCR34DRAFT_632447 [Clohesyomyces aquaticus]